MRAFAIALIFGGTLLGGWCLGAGQGRDSKNPVDILLRAESLDDSAVGYAGRRTATYDAFSQLYRAGTGSTDAAKHLVAAATPEGRVYGLLILRHIAPADAEALTREMLLDRTPVTITSGCLVHHSTVSELVAEIRRGEDIIFLPK